MTDIGPGFVLSTACLTAGFTLYFFLKANHMERMARIERGLPEEGQGRRSRSFMEIKFGMLLAGLGLGLLLAIGIEGATAFRKTTVIYPALMCLCGGLSSRIESSG